MSKGLEALENIKKSPALTTLFEYYSKELDIIEKELKALEIIKIRECIFKGLQNVSQEEYELLKEVLL